MPVSRSRVGARDDRGGIEHRIALNAVIPACEPGTTKRSVHAKGNESGVGKQIPCRSTG